MKYTVNALTLIVGSLCVASLASVDSAADQIDFHRDIVPILRDHCWHCHGEGEQESGLRLDRRAAMLRGGDYGQPTIVPGEPDKSYLIEVVDHRAAGIEMPPDADKLPKTQIALLTRWIREGAVWPGQMDAVVQIESDHWSFQPIERPDVPQVAVRSAEGLLDLAHARRGQQRLSAIDAFLLDRLRKENLTFSKPADPRSLIR